MARLPGEEWLIQQIDGEVVIYHEHTNVELLRFDPSDADQAAKAQFEIYNSTLSDEQKCYAHFWSGYFYRNATM